MADLQIETQTLRNALHIKIGYPNDPSLSFNFTLHLNIFEKNIITQAQINAYSNSFHWQQKQIEVKDLKYGTMYRVELKNGSGSGDRKRERTQNIYVCTTASQIENQQLREEEVDNSYGSRPLIAQNSFSRSRPLSANTRQKSLIKAPENTQTLSTSEDLIRTLAKSKRIANPKKVQNYLLAGRKCRNMGEFINEKEGRLVNINDVIDKRMMVAESRLLFEEVYKYRKGCEFFKNDWFMGPFYSYDKNESEVRKK